jgi:hypothetical protein
LPPGQETWAPAYTPFRVTTIGYQCATCGQWHPELPFAWHMEQPDYVLSIPEDERPSRVELSSDQCVIDDEFFFIRGLIEVPVLDATEEFAWGVWVSLSPDSFERVAKLWNEKGRESEPPYFGWLSNDLPLYPSTLNLKTNVHTRPVGQRPFVELQPTDHPLSIEQRSGITVARVSAIAQALNPDH